MFPTKLDALKFLASNREKIDWCKEDRNRYLDHINMGNDKENQGIPRSFRGHDGELRYYYDIQIIDRQDIFVDGLNRIIDFRVYRKEINYIDSEVKKRQKYYSQNGGEYMLDVNNGRVPFPNIVVLLYGVS